MISTIILLGPSTLACTKNRKLKELPLCTLNHLLYALTPRKGTLLLKLISKLDCILVYCYKEAEEGVESDRRMRNKMLGCTSVSIGFIMLVTIQS